MTESTTAAAIVAVKSKFELDYPFCDVELIVGKTKLIHRLRRPTFDELHRRFQLVINEEVSVSNQEVEPIYSDERANIFLYDEIVQAVQNYRTNATDAENWTTDIDLIRRLMTVPHKVQAVRALYQAEAEVIEDVAGDGLFPLVGAAEITVRLMIAGEIETRHILQAPTEGQWSQLQSKRVQTRQKKGQKRQHFTYQINLAPARDFYNDLLVRMEGVTLQSGAQFSATDRQLFVNAVDAIHKQMIVNAFCDYWGGRLQD